MTKKKLFLHIEWKNPEEWNDLLLNYFGSDLRRGLESGEKMRQRVEICCAHPSRGMRNFSIDEVGVNVPN